MYDIELRVISWHDNNSVTIQSFIKNRDTALFTITITITINTI